MANKKQHAYPYRRIKCWWMLFWIERIAFFILALSWVRVERISGALGFVTKDSFWFYFDDFSFFLKFTTALHLAFFAGWMFFKLLDEQFGGNSAPSREEEHKQESDRQATVVWLLGLLLERIPLVMFEDVLRGYGYGYENGLPMLNFYFIMMVPMLNIAFALFENLDYLNYLNQETMLEDLTQVFGSAERVLFWVERLGFYVMQWSWFSDRTLAERLYPEDYCSILYFWICTNLLYLLLHVCTNVYYLLSRDWKLPTMAVELENCYGLVNRIQDYPGFWSERLALVVFAIGIRLLKSMNYHSQWKIVVSEFCFVILFPLLNIYFAWFGYKKEFLCGGVLEERLSEGDGKNSGKLTPEEEEICQPNEIMAPTQTNDSTAPKGANDEEEIQTYLNDYNDAAADDDDSNENQTSEVVLDEGLARLEILEGMFDQIQMEWENTLEKILDKGLTSIQKQRLEKCRDTCERLKEQIDDLPMKLCSPATALLEKVQKIWHKMEEENSEWAITKEDDYQSLKEQNTVLAKEEELRQPNMIVAAATLTDDSTAQKGANDEVELQTYLYDDNDEKYGDTEENQQSGAVSEEDFLRLEILEDMFEEIQREWENTLDKIKDGGTEILKQMQEACDDFQELKKQIDELPKKFCTATSALLEEFRNNCQKMKEENMEWETKEEDDHQCLKEQNTELTSTVSTSISSFEENFQKDSQKTEELNNELMVMKEDNQHLKEQIRELELKLCAANTSSEIYRSLLHDCIFCDH